MYFTFTSNDTTVSHDVQLYSDISAEWVTGDNGLLANWTTTAGDVVTHQVQLVNQQPFVETSDHIQRECSLYAIKYCAC